LGVSVKINLEIENTENQAKNHSKDPELSYQIGNIYKKIGNPNKALLNFQKAYVIQPNSLKFLNSLATIHTDLKNYDQAINYFKKMFEIKPDLSIISYNIECLYAKIKQTEHQLSKKLSALKKKKNFR